MSKYDLDIVHSLEAETFLHMVTKGFYSNSYTGLWMYEVIGREWDEMRAWAEGMKKEINPQTCTWSIGIWEWVYGIETNKTLQLEYRRQRILAKILETKPVNPEVIRRGVARITGCDVNITDFAGPYRFVLAIHMKEDGDALPYESVREYVRMVKPSHLAAFLTWMFWIVINSKQLEQFLTPRIWMHWYIPFWKAPLLNSTKRYNLVLGIKNGIKFCIKEVMYTDKLYINILSCFNVYEKICGAKALFMLGDFNFWRCKILNGTKLLDGTKLLNTRRRYDLILGIKNNIKFCIKEIMDTDKLYINISSCFNVHEKICGINTLIRLDGFNFWNLVSSIAGNHNMPLKITVPVYTEAAQDIDVSRLVNGRIKTHIEEKTSVVASVKAAVNFLHGCHQITDSTGTVTKTRHIAIIKTSGTIENITITCRRNLHYLDGSKRVDGSRLLNAFYGKEEI